MSTSKQKEAKSHIPSQKPSLAMPQSSQHFYTIRQLISKRYLIQKDIQSLIDLISDSHISILGYLSRFLVNFRNQLILSDKLYIEKMRVVPNRMLVMDNQIELSRYFNCGRMIRWRIFADLAQVILRKFYLYIEKNAAGLCVNSQLNQQKSQLNISSSQMDNNELVLRHLYPQAHKLLKTIRTQISFMKQFYSSGEKKIQLNKEEFPKDRLVLKIMEKIKDHNSVVNETFSKQDVYQSQQTHFNDEEFYTIKQHTEKFTFNADFLNSPSNTFMDTNIKEINSLQPIPAKCAGCIPFMYKNRIFPRQRCSVMDFEVMNTIDDKKNLKKLKQLVQAFINSKNGGIIFFDCTDQFFGIKPQGLQCTLKAFEQKKQSLIDITKNNFPDLKIDKDYNIDFILFKDPQKSTNKTGNPMQREKDAAFIGRFRILKEKYSLIEKKQNTGKKDLNDYCLSMNHYVKKFNLQELSKLIQIETLRNNPRILTNLQQNKQCNYSQFILKCLQGRSSLLIRHEGRNCRQKPLQFYYNTESTIQQQGSQKGQNSEIKIVDLLDIKQPLNIQDKQCPNWCLLVVSVSEMKKIDSQMKKCFGNSNYFIQDPFQNCKFSQVKQTLLIKMSFSQEDFVKMVKSPQAQQNKYFRTQKKETTGYMPLIHIKVYDNVAVTYHKKPTDKELVELKNILTFQLKEQFSRSFYIQRNERMKAWLECLEINLFVHHHKPTIYITTNDYHPSYALLFIYYFLKNQSSRNDSNFKKVEFKQSKDLAKENGYIVLKEQQVLKGLY